MDKKYFIFNPNRLRRIKERYRVRYYVRYMDDCVILHHDRDFLKKIQAELALYLRELGLEFNKKTEIMPLKGIYSALTIHPFLKRRRRLISIAPGNAGG